MSFKNAIALTGGIATGKSTVATLLSLHGYLSIDADKISHKILDQSYLEIADMFGVKYIDNKTGTVLRKELGKLIFTNQIAKRKLEAFLHPKIKEQIIKDARIFEKENVPYFIDIPLFFETKNYDIKKSIVVYTSKEIQLQRAIKRDNQSEDYVKNIINSQIDIEKKKDMATYAINNNGTLKELQKEVEKFIKML